MTLAAIIEAIDRVNRAVGRTIAWLALLMALIQFVVVILRYVFAVGFIPMQESIWYLHGILFMAGAGFTLMHDGHVRIDIFYNSTTPRARALVDLWGSLFFLIPICILTVVLSWGYVTNSWRIFEGSTEISGLPFIYLLKTMLWVFAFLVGLQGIALVARALRYLRGETGDYKASADGPGIEA
ncbi:MAG: TRAP transporter small permease subunit [Hyphomicrobiales bacterium]|nr:TRAP transporter small permease subunit [Hyphomicrobiales bacterium]